MPTKTWEPPPFQSDGDTRRQPARKAEARNFESPRSERAANPDAAGERGQVDYDEINTHGSER